MTPLMKILAGVVPGVALASLSILFLLCCCCRRRQQPQPRQQLISSANARSAMSSPSQMDSFQSAIDKFRNRSNKNSLHFQQLNQKKQNIQHQHQQQQQQVVPPPFNWDAHPRLISEVVDHGWSQFVFADRSSVPRSSPLWSLCASCDSGWAQQESQQINWEAQANTSEFMQTVRITTPFRTKKTPSSSTSSSPLFAIDNSATSCTRMSLPLPGPPLIGLSFPQEAYFEISIAQLQPSDPRKQQRPKDGAAGDGDDDRLKLIDQNPCKVHSDGQIEMNSPPTTTEVKPSKPLVCLGLTRGGSTETKLIPGTYPGSIGFQSNGSLYLDGLNLVSETSKTEWAAVDKVIGCGFSPSRKKVYFTVDSELVHVIRCNSEVYKSPLYPILASNSDVTIVVNLGQAAFRYVPANSHRTANPCFLQSSPSYSCHSAGAYEDSREFFSVGMQDTECSDYAANGKSSSKGSTKSSKRIKHNNWEEESVNLDVDKDSDLFEIVLNY